MSTALARPVLVTGVVLAAAAVCAGCSSPAPAPDPGKGQLNISPTARPTAPSLPAAAPVVQTDCPYLDAPTVAGLNGEKVLYVRIDNRLTPPACFFYANDGKVQLSVTVATVGSAADAKTLVDQTVPTGSSERADLPGGWTGGKAGGQEGAVLAVATGPKVLVVRSDQEHSIKVQRIAEAVSGRV